MTIDQDTAKQMAAQAALDLLPESGIIGLGSGSTARLFIDGVGRLVQQGRRLVGVPTSEASRQQALDLGIELLGESGPWTLDLCVDGADEVSESLDLIKGGGGCQTREKIVNHWARENIIIVDESKLSPRLGTQWPVPVEVLAFAHQSTAAALSRIGEVKMRLQQNRPWITDADNYLYDVQVGPIDNPNELDARLLTIPGVVETGLFVKRADRVIVAGSNGIRQLTPDSPS